MIAELHVVVLAAGQGKRMKSPLPKVLAPLAGRTMLHHVIDRARELEPAGIHVVVGHGADAVREAFSKESDLAWVVQEQQLGTGHAVMTAVPGLPEDARVLVLLGDSPLIRAETVRELVAAAEEGGVAILTARLEDPAGYGRIVRAEDGTVAAIVEHRDASPDLLAIDEVNGGFLCASRTGLAAWLSRLETDNAQAEYYLTDVVALAREDGVPVNAVLAAEPEEILGANDRWQLARLERIAQRRIARRLCDSGATLLDPERLDVRGSLVVAPGVTIDVGCVFEGDCRLEEGASIAAHCVIRDSHLGPGTRVHPSSVLDGVRTEGDCDIGPFARMRPGSEMARGSKIGNFVETKKIRMEAGSQAKHLTYLGDAHVGADANIGAGTIICNYDGANKHPTTIGPGAFIGSGSQLVAPVTVGAGATVGAGSTITHPAPDGELTVARARQVTIPGWKRPTKKKD